MKNNCNCENEYKCGVCGEAYSTVAERMKCEQSCLRKQKEAEEKAAAEKKSAEKRARQAEVTAALDNAFALMNKFIEDYGSYNYDGKINALEARNMDFFPSKLWHHFWF